jgi:para-aminobenzoate synthetase
VTTRLLELNEPAHRVLTMTSRSMMAKTKMPGASPSSSSGPSTPGAPAASTSAPLLRLLIIDHFDSYTLNLLSLLSRVWEPHFGADSTAECSSSVKGKARERDSGFISPGSRRSSQEDIASAGYDARFRPPLSWEDHVLVLPHTHHLLATEHSIRQNILPHIDAIILSPGPGSPHNEEDFGAGARILRIVEQQQRGLERGERSGSPTPVFGVCLGHQGIAAVFGGRVRRAKSIRHGVKSELVFSSDAGGSGQLFEEVNNGCEVVRYNSLTIDPRSEPLHWHFF